MLEGEERRKKENLNKTRQEKKERAVELSKLIPVKTIEGGQ